MSIFKKEEDVVEVEEKDTFRPKRVVKEGDVKKRKKKEPPKPWTKKERYLVLGVLLFTIITSGVLAMSAREWKLPGFPRISFPSSIFKEEKIVIEGGSGGIDARWKEKGDVVIDNFNEAVKDLSGVYGLYVVNLSTGNSFGIGENDTFQAASLIKLPVMVGIYQQAEEGKLNLDDKYILKSSDKIDGAGTLASKPEGYQVTYREMLYLMGHYSDNTAYGICRDYLGEDKFNQITQSIGMDKTSLSDNSTSPKDIGTYFYKLWKGDLIDLKDRDELLTNITDTIYEQWLKAGVPSDVRVAHKYGREVHVVNDAGIIYTDNPYVVVIMTKGVVEREADEVFPKLSAIVYQGLTD